MFVFVWQPCQSLSLELTILYSRALSVLTPSSSIVFAECGKKSLWNDRIVIASEKGERMCRKKKEMYSFQWRTKVLEGHISENVFTASTDIANSTTKQFLDDIWVASQNRLKLPSCLLTGASLLTVIQCNTSKLISFSHQFDSFKFSNLSTNHPGKNRAPRHMALLYSHPSSEKWSARGLEKKSVSAWELFHLAPVFFPSEKL